MTSDIPPTKFILRDRGCDVTVGVVDPETSDMYSSVQGMGNGRLVGGFLPFWVVLGFGGGAWGSICGLRAGMVRLRDCDMYVVWWLGMGGEDD